MPRKSWAEKTANWTEADRERERARHRDSYQRHRDKRIARSKKWVAENYTHFKSERTRRRSEVYGISYVLWRSAKNRASREGIPFDLMPQDIQVPQYCPALGLELKIAKRAVQPNSPSLDRIKPDLGYIKGNVQVISHRANCIKTNANGIEVMAVALFMKRMGQ